MSEIAIEASGIKPQAPAQPARLSRWKAATTARLDDLKLASAALTAHPMRSSLTLLGIVIGVFTVVAMMALMNGLQQSINKGIGGLGADVFQLQKWPAGPNFGPPDPSVQRRKPLTLQQVIQLREQFPQAKQVGGEVWEGGKDIYGDSGTVARGVQVAGGTAEFFTNNSLPIASGRGFQEGEAMGASRVVVLGASVVDSLFPGQNPLGQRVRLGRLQLEVIGTIERQGGGPFGGNPDAIAALPIGLFYELYGTGRSVNITVMAHSADDMKRTMDGAIAAFRRIRGLRADQDNDFDYYSNESMKATFDQMANNVNLFMVAVCGLSLLVGGIGVMNIMLVAVAERTKEIGLRKALGARKARILMQFVLEAVMLALFGGIVGVLLGYMASGIASFAADLPTEVPLWAVALGLGVSSAIGLVFGIYPAARAARLDPAVALRSE
jgi:putative ABC transport system permease protein